MMSQRDATTLLPLSAAHFHILLTLAEGACHGYAIKRRVEERTDGRVRLAAGSLYEGIQRLVRNGLLAETDAPDDGQAPASSRWRFYGMTPFGRDVLAAELARLEADLAWARDNVPDAVRGE